MSDALVLALVGGQHVSNDQIARLLHIHSANSKRRIDKNMCIYISSERYKRVKEERERRKKNEAKRIDHYASVMDYLARLSSSFQMGSRPSGPIVSRVFFSFSPFY